MHLSPRWASRGLTESPKAARQPQDKVFMFTTLEVSNVVLRKLRLASSGEDPGLAPFNSQTDSCGMLQLLVTIPSPAGTLISDLDM